MVKRKNNRTEKAPTMVNRDFPVFVPNDKGETEIDVGVARLRSGVLTVELKNTASSVAIQRMMERGVLMGFGLIMIEPDAVNEQYQEIVEQEETQKKVNLLFEQEDAAAGVNTEARPDEENAENVDR